ncbi:MAG: hypothetical protein RL508_368 [Actinomycetota bacterium]|jgi:AcrR family transcriptional regulator
MARPKGNREATEARRRAIVEAAFEVFGRFGYNGSSLAQVAEIVGITDAAIVHHFGSKRELMLAVLTRRDDLDNTLIFDDDNGIDFSAIWLDIAEYNYNHPGIVELFTVLAAEATSEAHPAHEYFKDRYVMVYQRLLKSFECLRREGHLKSKETCEALARKLIALSDGMQVQWLLDRSIQLLDYHTDFYKEVLKPSAWELVLAKRKVNEPMIAEYIANNAA